MLMLSLAQTVPNGLTDVLGVPLICFVLGLGFWYGGLHFESKTEKVWLKWCAVIPLLIGLVIGLPMAIQVMDYAYQQLMPNKKVIYGHYMAAALPLLGLAVIFSWHFYLKRSGAYEKF